MAQIYLYLNSLLFFGIAVRSTMAPRSTATGLGFLTLSDRGRAEYLVVYGGLQLGLAILFFLLARNPAYFRLGLLVSAGFYAPILVYRLSASFRHGPAPTAVLGTIALEAGLLAAAIWLYYPFLRQE
ncbi:DUF4345 family protein [Hymenobacter sp. YC55]|uniref:DUF4345 family protein n=1 Tax=Hymenobacter sp. YC55 TaxID=3034019 RepID=UPI0023F733B5|nr:DUF4345 family protein [Hymenobacter sp. YC55]MDF7815772.1 hypothetical protein [Hymenobacter sp. YC55]